MTSQGFFQLGQLKDGGVDRRPWALASTPAPKLNGKFLGMTLGTGFELPKNNSGICASLLQGSQVRACGVRAGPITHQLQGSS